MTTALQTRVKALQNPLDRALYHPLAARLARLLARTPVTPNMVSVGGGMAIVLAGIAYVQPGWPWTALLGLVLHMSWHVLDGADGDLARLTGKASPTGEIVDGLCDYSGHLVLYLMLGSMAAQDAGWLAWALMLGGGVSHILQASFHQSQRRRYLNWIHGVPWLGSTGESAAGKGLGRLGRAYLVVSGWFAPYDQEVEAALTDPVRGEALRARILELGPEPLSGSTLLGSNYRTIALGLSMFAGSPLWYFAFELVVLNLLLLATVVRSRKILSSLRAML
ncbi:CDP-alcohol phosphatidyltransferase family protein [Parerythrobacter aestuarii]|uniref:CDP-alcohol phosphatidyltransferase family protein n=1 Tax=Parerythrobacter aestuarii TaxID=3020909 RepID=UPI0024DEB96F|nr:CDP-alcohol phosphatidyltransferase family protein [Parerythrobacter aestuarii]